MNLNPERLRATSTEDLLVLLRFFDCDRLRHHYNGLIADIRSVLAERDPHRSRIEALRQLLAAEQDPHYRGVLKRAIAMLERDR